MSRKGSWDDDGSSLSESLLRFVHGGDEANPPTPRSVTQALALTPATRERRNSDLDELTFYYSPEEPGVRGEVRVGLDRSVDRYDEDDDDDALVDAGGASFASWRDEGEGGRTSTLDPESGSSTPSIERAASARSSASSSGRSDESFSTESGDASRDARDSRDAGFGDRLLSTPPPREDPAEPEPSAIASRGVPRERHSRRTPVPPGTRSREWLRRVPPNSDTAVNAPPEEAPGEPPRERGACAQTSLFFSEV